MKKILFVLKKRLSYGSYGISFGLINSAKFVARELDKIPGIETKVVEVQDNNAIDKEVVEFKPTHVIIEALWVVPSKFPVLIEKHPKIQWHVRLHSKPAFIANEGIAFDWIGKYIQIGKETERLHVSTNNKEFSETLTKIYQEPVSYSPNIYPDVFRSGCDLNPKSPVEINIGCFGALRPLKSHLPQALAAIAFARSQGKHLKFHINSDRIEQRGEEVLKNLRALFADIPHAELIEHPWREHKEFIHLVSQMDLGMQVSLSETYNIIAADFISVGVPVLVCRDVEFAPTIYVADPTSTASMEKGLHRLYTLNMPLLTYWAKLGLIKSNEKAIASWKQLISNSF